MNSLSKIVAKFHVDLATFQIKNRIKISTFNEDTISQTYRHAKLIAPLFSSEVKNKSLQDQNGCCEIVVVN